LQLFPDLAMDNDSKAPPLWICTIANNRYCRVQIEDGSFDAFTTGCRYKTFKVGLSILL
jgi:hypothetical protein